MPVDEQGIVDLDALEQAVRSDTVLVSVMLANNETGTVEPVARVVEIAKQQGALVHTDAVQAAGKIPVNVDELGVDLLTLTAHKTYGPKGIGALYVRPGTKVDPLLHGGHHERGRRAGTENVAAAVGFAQALLLSNNEMHETSGRLAGLRDELLRRIKADIERVQENGCPVNRLPNTLNVGFESVEGESLLLTLDTRGIAVSTGAACTSGAVETSHVLNAMGVPAAIARGSIRISLGRDNTREQVDYVARTLVEVVGRLRETAPSLPE